MVLCIQHHVKDMEHIAKTIKFSAMNSFLEQAVFKKT